MTTGVRPGSPMYYSGGEGARVALPDCQTPQTIASLPVFCGQSDSTLTCDEVSQTHSNPHYVRAQSWISQESYIAITDYLTHTSWRSVSLSRIDTLPSLEELNVFARLYFDKFHETFPLLHKGTFLSHRNGCLLELAISAVGACYVKTRYARRCSESLHELVHELLKIATISEDDQHRFPGVFGTSTSGYPQRLTRLQARILNVLGMFHSCNPRLASFAREDRATLVATCIESRILTSNHYSHLQGSYSIEEGDLVLQQWLEGELNCRAGYSVWVR